MNERKLQFRVGLFVLTAMLVAGGIIFKFGDFQFLFEEQYLVAVHFPTAPGVYPASPVKLNGISIGSVREVVIDEKRGGVTVLIDVNQRYRLRRDTQPHLSQSLLGDSSIEFTAGSSSEFVDAATILEGVVPVEPMRLVEDMYQKMAVALSSFENTSLEWQRVAGNLNNILDTNEGNLNVVVERASTMLQQLTLTMQTANKALGSASKMLADPVYQENLRQSMQALPEVVRSTQQTILAIRDAVTHINDNLGNLKDVTEPLAKHSTSIVTRLDNTLKNLDSLSGDLRHVSRTLAHEDGSFKKLISDPHLYNNLNRSAESLALLLQNLQPAVRDLRVFSDKIARHPELIGVRGALKGSSGLKNVEDTQPLRDSSLQRPERR